MAQLTCSNWPPTINRQTGERRPYSRVSAKSGPLNTRPHQARSHVYHVYLAEAVLVQSLLLDEMPSRR